MNALMHDPLAGTEDFDPFAGDLQRVIATTEAQREVWLADRLSPQASLAYNESVDLRLRGPLDMVALRAAMDALAARHDALRATFSADGMQLMIGAPAVVPLAVLDLGAHPDAQAELARARTQAVQTPFDLENGPLLRAMLIRLAPEDHVLQMTAHHAVCDGWSWGVIAQDLGQLYNEQLGAGPAPLPAPSYADYAAWEQAETHTRQRNLSFWLARFAGSALPALELPLDRPRPAVRGFASQRLDDTLDSALAAELRQLGARSGTSLFGTLFTSFAALMAHLAQQDDLVVGVPSAGQAASGMPALVGHCVNLLPIRVQVDGEAPAEAVLRQTGSTLLDAFDHQVLTYGTLLQQLPLPRDPSRPALVSLMFNLDPGGSAEAGRFAHLDSTLEGNPRHFENFELFLNIVPAPQGGLLLQLQYNTGLFDEATVRRWLHLYREVLQRLVASPARPLAELLAPTAEDEALLAQFNATALAVDGTQRIEALIGRQAAATPDATAIVAGTRRLSYRALDQQANAIAHALQAAGVRGGDLVGLCCARDTHMFAALLGVLKAGAGYVPLDPAFPRERLEFMVQDAGLRVLVADATTAAPWAGQGLTVVRADDPAHQAPAAGAAQAAPPVHGGDAGQVAYVIYTSGSTGRPKGVRVPHRSVVNLLASLRHTPGLTAAHTTLSVTTLSFDIAVSEVIMPLTTGATVVVADKAQAMDGERLRALVEQEEVRFIDATPSTWRLLLEAGWPGRPDLLAVCTGEPLPADLARQLLPRVGQLWNGYGPTETTVWSSFHHVEHVEGPVPIGRPVANTAFHVLDARQRPLPVGVTGELHIAGAGVTLGYLDRPELTAERFIPPPGQPEATGRWYRTGDLGRWRSDGVLECLGRADHQVKVRGYRIELGEIEANLARHPGIERALVVTREDVPGDVRIVAYVVPRGPLPEASVLRGFLAAFLPEYMLPQHYVALQDFPVLPNGKTDRNALPAPQAVAGAPRPPAQPPRNALERQVLQAMERILTLPGIGMDDDFFALGGHSLLAVRLGTALGREFGIKVPMATLFESPTPARLAQAIDRLRSNGDQPALEPIPALADRRSAPLTPAQERIRFMESLYPGRSVYNAPSGHRFTGPLDVEALRGALAEIVRRQPSLRVRVGEDPATGEPLQLIEPEVPVALEVTDLRDVPAPEREQRLMTLLQAAADAPFDIRQGPLFRFGLYVMGENDHAFIFVPHHLVWDGWSFDVFQAELSALYRARVDGRPHGLAPLAVTQGDYAQWFHAWMQGPEFTRQLAHWKQRFAQAPVAQSLPTDFPRRASMSGEGGTVWVQMDRERSEQLREAALAQNLTLSMFCFAAYVLTLADLSPNRTLVVAMPVRAREHPELEGVMGFFNNVLPLSFSLGAGLTGAQFLAQVKAELLSVMNHQLVPFERLVQEPEFAARAQGLSLYQALFSFQDARERPHDIGGLGHQQVHLRQRGVTDDMALWLLDKAQGIEGPLGYNTELYTAQTATAVRDRFLALLDRLARSPGATLETLLAPEDSPAAAHLAQLKARTVAAPLAAAGVAAPARETAPAARAPLGGTQAQLAAVWADALHMDASSIRADDNFFDLGGDSLLAMRVVGQAEAALGFRIEPRRYVFENLGRLADPALGQPLAPKTKPSGLLGRLFGGFGKGGGA